jgi:selenocysteine-specific elongation factor
VKYATLGVIGHVDHGKTTLVKALTGTNTDRLQEEKDRGISIALGYAYLDVPEGRWGVVDVPGHEKFIRTMVSGATGIRAVLLVLDVNEGVKPQTTEHIHIAELLGVEYGAIALTKCDTADEDMRELAQLELKDHLEGTFLEDAPIIETAAVSGDGLPELNEALNQLLDKIPALPLEDQIYLPIDRVFSMTGFGTVITGTLQRGVLKKDGQIEVFPKGFAGQIRELQSHGETVTEVEPGHRTAVNLRGMDKASLKRGDVLATPGSLQSGAFLDVQLKVLEDTHMPVKQRNGVRILFGTLETFGRLHLLDRDEISPGDTALCQIQLDEPCAVLFQNRFILRSTSPMLTIGGGVILGVSDTRRKRNEGVPNEWLGALAENDPKSILGLFLNQQKAVSLKEFSVRYRQSEIDTKIFAQEPPFRLIGDHWIVRTDTLENLYKTLLKAFEEYHQANPTGNGLTDDSLKGIEQSTYPTDVIKHALKQLEVQGKIHLKDGGYVLADSAQDSGLKGRELELAEEIESAFKGGGLQPPGIVEVCKNDKQRIRLYRYLVDQKRLITVSMANKPKTLGNTIVFHSDTLMLAEDLIRRSFSTEKPFSPSDAKQVLGASRKYVMPLLECLDSRGVTKRTEEGRVVR